MECNKNESELCLRIARKCILKGEIDKAFKYLYKAQRLYPSKLATDLKKRLETSIRGSSFTNGYQFNSRNEPKSNDDSNFGAERQQFMDNDASTAKEYTDEQVESVRRVNNCKDFHEILGLPRNASASDLKKQYKKLALQFHPDKNKTPGAAEAFKAIRKSFAVLSDPEKRRQYDMSRNGANVPNRGQDAYYTYYYAYARERESNISLEELFKVFFSRGFPYGMPDYADRRRSRRRHGHQKETNYSSRQEDRANYSFRITTMALFLVSVSLLTTLFPLDPDFCLERTPQYVSERKTSELEIPYFVKANFATEFQGSIRRLETRVEERYIAILRKNCLQETRYRENRIQLAKAYDDKNLEERAKSLKVMSCDCLNELYRKRIR